jgi:hypothetical protein
MGQTCPQAVQWSHHTDGCTADDKCIRLTVVSAHFGQSTTMRWGGSGNALQISATEPEDCET